MNFTETNKTKRKSIANNLNKYVKGKKKKKMI